MALALTNARFSPSQAGRVQARIKQIADSRPNATQAECNDMTHVVTQHQMGNVPGSGTQPSNNTVRPVMTTCNRVFGQVNCMTY